jgi:hypothetical protein
MAQAMPSSSPAATAATVATSTTTATAPRDDVALAGVRASAPPAWSEFQVHACQSSCAVSWRAKRIMHVLRLCSRQGAGHGHWRHKRGQVRLVPANQQGGSSLLGFDSDFVQVRKRLRLPSPLCAKSGCELRPRNLSAILQTV